MILCSCNVLRDADIDRAISDGAPCPDAVYAACGGHAQCGRCRSEIEDRIADAAACFRMAAE